MSGGPLPNPAGCSPAKRSKTVLQNPTAYHFYRGWDFLYYNGTNNEPAGVDIHAIRTDVFDYYGTNWSIIDDNGSTLTPLTAGTTAAAGMKYDFTLTSTNTYVATLTPLSNPSSSLLANRTARRDQFAHQLHQFPVMVWPKHRAN